MSLIDDIDIGNIIAQNDYYEYLLSNAGNNQMPTLNRDLQMLNLTRNKILVLTSEEFNRKKWRNLQKIYLNSNKIKRIDNRAFHKLTGLVELDLSDNQLARLEDQIDQQEAELLQASLSEPAIETSLKIASRGRNRGTFLSELTQLRILDLSGNNITKLDDFSFSALNQLRQLHLSRFGVLAIVQEQYLRRNTSRMLPLVLVQNLLTHKILSHKNLTTHRNQIDFISSQAFEGLNQLNVLDLE